jgi:hypothetical protein
MNTLTQNKSSPVKKRRKSYLLRINEDLWNELNEWSGQEFRSVNGQIELILQRAVDDRRRRKRDSADEDRPE